MRMGLAPNLHQLVDGDEQRVSTREMNEVADRDDAIREAIVIAAKHLGIAAANVVTILHPDMVVLGGGVAEIGDLLVNTVRDVVRERVCMFPTDNVQIEKSLLGEMAGLIGAVALAIDAVRL
jgi:glucokinase